MSASCFCLPFGPFKEKSRIQLSSLPELIQTSIVEKLDMVEFVRFQLASKDSMNFGNSIKRRITVTHKPRHADDVIYQYNRVEAEMIQKRLYFRFNFNGFRKGHGVSLQHYNIRFDAAVLLMKGNINNDFCNSATEIFNKTNSTAISVEFHPPKDQQHPPQPYPPVPCSPEIVDRFFEAAGTESFSCNGYVFSPDFLSLPAFKKMSRIRANFDNVQKEDLLGLTAKIMLLTGGSSIDSWSINELLKQFLRRERDIEQFKIFVNNPLEWILFAGIRYDRIPKHSHKFIITGDQPSLKRIVLLHNNWLTINK